MIPVTVLVDDNSLGREQESRNFTSVISCLQQVYTQQKLVDISTSYCFICLLHLANEKGLALGNKEGLQEISIEKDLDIKNIDTR